MNCAGAVSPAQFIFFIVKQVLSARSFRLLVRKPGWSHTALGQTLARPQDKSGQAQVGMRSLTGQRAALLAKGQIANPGETWDGLLHLAGHFPDPIAQRYRSTSTVRQKDRDWMCYTLRSVTDDVFHLADQLVRSAHSQFQRLTFGQEHAGINGAVVVPAYRVDGKCHAISVKEQRVQDTKQEDGAASQLGFRLARPL